MKTVFLTLALDAMPFITRLGWEFQRLKLDWEWRVAEGVAAPVGCTSWCAQVAPRLSEDGTTEFLDAFAGLEKRMVVLRRELWHGKVAMLNKLLETLYEPCLLVQVDADEFWTAEQLTRMHDMFVKTPARNCAYFWSDYRVGPRVRITSRDTYGNNSSYEWMRAWRFQPGMRFKTHEPPKFEGFEERPFTHAETEREGLVMRHDAYVTEAQVAWKKIYYGSSSNKSGALYKGAVKGWRDLQENRVWPVKDLKKFLPWVGDNVCAELCQP